MLNPYQQYANNSVNTAPPEELTLMLYKGAVRFISLAIRAIESNNIEETSKNIIKAQDIYVELMTTLDKQYEISKDLSRLYDFMIYLLTQANINKDKGLLEEALKLARDFAETWEEAIKIYRKSQPSKQIGQTG